MPSHTQDEAQAHSLRDPEGFWSHQADQLHWHKKPSRALKNSIRELADGVQHPAYSWFPGGEISTSYNCVDRHVKTGNGDSTAIIWDSPVTGSKEQYTYKQLLSEVEVLAGVLREEGVKKGDVVLIHMPMIPAALFAILAVSRLGAVHTVVFGGFAPTSLAQRIEASKPRVIMTASCGVEGAKGPVEYKPFVEGALEKSSFKPEKIVVWQREQIRWDPIDRNKGERNWQKLVEGARRKGIRADAVPVKSNDGLYIIYTSGTTGLPKGVLREAGGHAVGLSLSIRYLFGIKGPGDTIFCASDIGWVVGHSVRTFGVPVAPFEPFFEPQDMSYSSAFPRVENTDSAIIDKYILYAPLLAGAATVLFEGKPVGTPNAGTFWRVLSEYKVNILFTAPTALRAIRRDDPQNSFFSEVGKKGGLRNLRALFLAGERSEPSIVRMYESLLQQYCAPNAQVIDNWWSSESGSPISGIALLPSAGQSFTSTSTPSPLLIRPGSAGKPMPGFDVRIVDDDGNEVGKGTMGNIVLAAPLAPTGFTTLFNDPERYYKGYLKRFNGRWIDTGDAGMVDEDGYVHVMSRSDDIINVAAHRFSTGAIEQAISSHSDIAECCVVGIPDQLKGHLPFAFVTLSTAEHPTSALPDPKLFEQVQKSIRAQIGAIAALGGMVQGKGMIPKTRSGKTLRRVLRELVENAVHGEVEKEVSVPATVEDAGVVEVARGKIREYFEEKGGEVHRAAEERVRPKL